ncbi:hypothetical protein KI387_005836, partial [Taxus chinensis]
MNAQFCRLSGQSTNAKQNALRSAACFWLEHEVGRSDHEKLQILNGRLPKEIEDHTCTRQMVKIGDTYTRQINATESTLVDATTFPTSVKSPELVLATIDHYNLESRKIIYKTYKVYIKLDIDSLESLLKVPPMDQVAGLSLHGAAVYDHFPEFENKDYNKHFKRVNDAFVFRAISGLEDDFSVCFSYQAKI